MCEWARLSNNSGQDAEQKIRGCHLPPRLPEQTAQHNRQESCYREREEVFPRYSANILSNEKSRHDQNEDYLQRTHAPLAHKEYGAASSFRAALVERG